MFDECHIFYPSMADAWTNRVLHRRQGVPVDLPLPGMLLKVQGFLPSVQNSLINIRQVYGSKSVGMWRMSTAKTGVL
jgi:hypothetical protein